MRAVHVLALDRQHGVDDEHAVDPPRHHPGHEVHALEHHRPALGERALDRAVDADEHVARLLEEAEHGRVAGLGVDHRLPGLEARVVDRRHERLGEERAHRLADEVGRRDAGDAEPVGRLGGDGRLARAGRAADEEQDRQVERVQRGVAAQAAHDVGALLVAEHLARELLDPVEVGGARVALGEVDLDPRRQLVRALDRDAGGDERPRHQALRVGHPARLAERQRLAVPPRAHAARSIAGTQSEQRLVEPVADDVVRGEHDAAAARERVLGDHVDRGRLHLDEIGVGLEPRELAAERVAVGEARRVVHDVGVEVRDVGRPGGEDRDAALERLERPQPQRRRHGAGQLAVHRDHEVGDEPAVGVEVRVDVVPVADEQHAPVDRDRRDRRAARVEDDDVGLALGREARPLLDVRDEDLPREPAAGAAAADRGHAADRGDLEVVGGGVPPGARQLDEVGDGRPLLDHLRLGRAAAAHRDHDHVAVAREQRGQVRRERGLPHPLAGADHGDRRQREVGIRRRVEAEVGADVGEAGGERLRRPAEAILRPEHRLVGQVDHGLGVAEVLQQRHAVVGVAAQLLGTADEDRADPLVRQHLERLPHDVGVVLPVDERDSLHLCGITSRSILPVYFSYSSVARSNWMMRSWPWNG